MTEHDVGFVLDHFATSRDVKGARVTINGRFVQPDRPDVIIAMETNWSFPVPQMTVEEWQDTMVYILREQLDLNYPRHREEMAELDMLGGT